MKDPIPDWRFRLKQTLRFAILLTFACATVVALSNFALAQKVDLAFGGGTLLAPGISSTSGDHSPVSLSGGTYLGFSGDVILFHNLGFGTTINWRASQAPNYGDLGFNFRPLFYEFNAVYSPKIVKHAYLEVVGGIGALNTHFYTGTNCGTYSCTNYQGIHHFMGDFGGGLKLYTKHNIFIRPEARVYLVNNNLEFSSAHAVRVGASIGYTFK